MRIPALGRRGAALGVLAALDVIMATRLLTVDQPYPEFYSWLAGLMPLWVPALVWACAAIVIGSQILGRRDTAAWTAAVVLKEIWAALHILAWLCGGNPDGWTSAALWTALAALAAVIAGWADHQGGPWTRS